MKRNTNLLGALACVSSLLLVGVNALALADETSAAPSPSQDPAAKTPKLKVTNIHGPLLDDVLADVDVLHAKDMYYAYATNTKEHNVPMAKSKDKLTGWKAAGDAMPHNIGEWAVDSKSGHDSQLWGPQVSQLKNGHFIMYYAAHGKDAPNKEHCIGIARCPNATGPFNPDPKPWYCPQKYGAIDPSLLQFGNRMFVVWKAGSKVPTGSHIAVWEVDPSDGSTKKGNKKYVNMENPNKQGWEGPTITRLPHNGDYLLIHTEGDWRDNYTLHYAIGGQDIFHEYKTPANGGLLLGDGAKTVDNKELFRPGSPNFIDNSNKEFFFFAESSKGSQQRMLYYGEVEYN